MRFALPTSALMMAVMFVGCNGDDDDTTPVDTREWTLCADEDKDGICAEDGDCDDANPEIKPGSVELCNGVDDNCNGITDEGTSDVDGDGTCDDQDAEECDGLDNDGDGMVDEDFSDGDSDGIADCVDTEECDGLDNNGDGTVDEGYDADGDGYTQCGERSGESVDCDDGNKEIYPGADEVEDAADNDCDGLIDEGMWAVGDLIVTEIFVNPYAVADNFGEWFEVMNTSGRSVYLNGLVIQSGAGEHHQIDSSDALILESGDYAVVGINSDKSANGNVALDYEYTDIVLSNEEDEVSIWVFDETSSGNVSSQIDRVVWDDGKTFPDLAGASMTLESLFLDESDNDAGENWCIADDPWALGSDSGSPGMENPPCSTYDHDNDGVTAAEGDCDDNDPLVFPGAPEFDSAVDNDCDGDIEEGPEAEALLDGTSSSNECGMLYLDGSGSIDPNADNPLVYMWTLISGPTASLATSADIVDSDSAEASFSPDEAGLYTFSLTVWDSGGAASIPVTLEVDVASRTSNNTPVADGGPHQTFEETADCKPKSSSYECSPCDDKEFLVDGTGSSDLDGDSMTYFWNISSGTGRVYNPWTPTTTVILSGSTPTYDTSESEFVSATNTVFLDLVVTDCMGAVSPVNTIALAYTCLGSD